MISRRLTFSLLSYWHVGTGKGAGPTYDAVVIRTPAGLPYLPGKAIKGLLREAAETARKAGAIPEDPELLTRLFGTSLDPGPVQENETSTDAKSVRENALEQARFRTKPGCLVFSSAVLGDTPEEARRWEAWAHQNPSQREHLFREFSSTSIDDKGLAKDRTLRSIEVVVPLKLHATIRGPDEDWPRLLEVALPFMDGVGAHRTRGMGRVQVTLEVP